jgi:hypothetical protein
MAVRWRGSRYGKKELFTCGRKELFTCGRKDAIMLPASKGACETKWKPGAMMTRRARPVARLLPMKVCSMAASVGPARATHARCLTLRMHFRRLTSTVDYLDLEPLAKDALRDPSSTQEPSPHRSKQEPSPH